ncbi:MAG: DNA repair protein RecO C-terminal domain-containing protein [Bacteroidaceae bacterium]
MIQTTSAIVLHIIKYNETQRIVHLYAEGMGYVACVVKLSHSNRSSLRPQLFQSLTILEVSLERRSAQSLFVIRDARLFYPYVTAQTNVVKSSILLFLAEFLDKVLRNEGMNPPLFSFLLTSLQWYDLCERGISNFHLVFMMRLSVFLGIYPNTEEYQEGAFFDLRVSCFVLFQPLHPNYLASEEAARLGLLMRMRFETMHLFPFDRKQRNRCLELLVEYYRLHITDFSSLKSIDVLKELFN